MLRTMNKAIMNEKSGPHCESDKERPQTEIQNLQKKIIHKQLSKM